MTTLIAEQAQAEQQADGVINDIHPLSRKKGFSNKNGLSLQDIRGALQDIEDLDGFLIPRNLLDEHGELNSLLNLGNLGEILAELSDPSFSFQPRKDLEPRENIEKATLLKNLIGQEVAVSSARPECTAEGVTFDGICRIENAENIEIISQEPLQLRGEFYVVEGSLTNDNSNLPGETSVKGITFSFTSASIHKRVTTNEDAFELSQAAWLSQAA
ncbi:MAG: hypothetical protein ACO3XO_07430 [Bdellovibrionota bacterium]